MDSIDLNAIYESYMQIYEDVEDLDEVTGGGKVEYKPTFHGTSEKPLWRHYPPDNEDPHKRGMADYPGDKTLTKMDQLTYERSKTPKGSRARKELERRLKGLEKRYSVGGGERQNYTNKLYDHYDIVLEYLLDEGLCESVENAEIMMAHMSEGWIDSILDEATIMSVSREGKPVYKLPKAEERRQNDEARDRSNISPGWRERARFAAAAKRERNKKTKSSIQRLNAIKNIERHSRENDYEVGAEDIPQSKKAGYSEADRETHLAHVRRRARARRGR